MANELLLRTTNRDIISLFAHSIEEKTGRPFNEFKWPSMLVYFHLINNRADIYYQTRKQNHLEGNYEDYTEVLPCVEMQKVDIISDCPCAPPSGCYFMKSVLPLPKFVGGAPTLVTSLTAFDKYEFVEWVQFKHRINNVFPAFNKKLLYTLKTIDNERWLYTYITSDDDEQAQSVKVAGVPIDPMEMFFFPICGKKRKEICNLLDLNFVIEKRLISVLFDTTYRKLIEINNNMRVGDTKGDDRDAETSPDPRF